MKPRRILGCLAAAVIAATTAGLTAGAASASTVNPY